MYLTPQTIEQEIDRIFGELNRTGTLQDEDLKSEWYKRTYKNWRIRVGTSNGMYKGFARKNTKFTQEPSIELKSDLKYSFHDVMKQLTKYIDAYYNTNKGMKC